MTMRIFLAALLLLVCQPETSCGAGTRIKDVVAVKGVRANQLIGYGLVVGLNGTGDNLRNSPFTQQSVQSMLDRMGVNVRGAQTQTRNSAAVMVMAEIPAFVGRGSRIDVTVASMGDASSLAGGSLLMTPLSGADNTIYAVAQGPVAVTGYAAAGKSENVSQGVPTSGRIPNGALVEREPPGQLAGEGPIELELRNPDFKTAIAVVDAVNDYSMKRAGVRVAAERDLQTVVLQRPTRMGTARFLSEIGELTIMPDTPARIVIDERSGTIVIGSDVQISNVAVAHGNISVRVTETPSVSQPTAFSNGRTVVTSETAISVSEKGGSLNMLRGTSLNTLVSGLNKIGLKPRGIIAVLQAIKSAGALQAELVVQ